MLGYGVLVLPSLNDRHDGERRKLRHYRLQLGGNGLRVGQVGDYETRDRCELYDHFDEVAVPRLLEIEKDRDVLSWGSGEQSTNRIKNRLPLGSEAPQDKHAARCDFGEHATDAFAVEAFGESLHGLRAGCS